MGGAKHLTSCHFTGSHKHHGREVLGSRVKRCSVEVMGTEPEEMNEGLVRGRGPRTICSFFLLPLSHWASRCRRALATQLLGAGEGAAGQRVPHLSRWFSSPGPFCWALERPSGVWGRGLCIYVNPPSLSAQSLLPLTMSGPRRMSQLVAWLPGPSR